MSLVPKHIKNLKPYVAGKSSKEFLREFSSIKPVKLASNENPIGCSPKSIKRVKDILLACNRYPDSSGFELRNILAQKFRINLDNVILGAGSEGIMSNIMRTFLSHNDKIVSSMNSFIGFKVLADASGYESIWVAMKDYHYDLNAIADKIDSNTKIIYLANPDNPTGSYFTIKQFDDFMKNVPARTLIILDEAYYEYAKNIDDYPDSMAYRYDNVITLRTFSKVFGLAGFRVGYGFAHHYLIDNLMKVKLPFEPSTLAQEAALGALDDSDFLLNSLNSNHSEKQRLYKFFDDNKIKYIPSATNFITIVHSNRAENIMFCDALLSYGIIVRNLVAFGLPHCTRITIGNINENSFFLETAQRVLDKKIT